jgi:hypothetical protein
MTFTTHRTPPEIAEECNLYSKFLNASEQAELIKVNNAAAQPRRPEKRGHTKRPQETNYQLRQVKERAK